ncbi:hypothetical protein GCM10029976_049590 [Kribbella albertanoniae]|uniref:hypothetical protein n=1 Tax=Kribbella albertanoniae TaxID=1266829 RepID=UPI0014048E6C|nr:hypothetical protein [Kribbella albertanoniae]
MSLLGFIAELATEEYRLDPADSLQETRDNTWYLFTPTISCLSPPLPSCPYGALLPACR